MWLEKRTAGVVVATLVGSAGGGVAHAATVLVNTSSGVSAVGPIKVKFFWSAVLRLFITIVHHASQAMAARNVSRALLKTILNEGKKTTRNGVAYVRYGNYEARVNVNTGKVITVVKLTGGGGGGGGV
ncbi:hypothetical protein GCM10027024_09250 [Microbacterium insulae]